MGDVGDQDRRAVRVNADRPVQPWLLTSHERQEALQSGFVILGGGNRPIRGAGRPDRPAGPVSAAPGSPR